MARVFISHSSRDNTPADKIKTWLETQGFDTPFLDFDKHAGIPPGAAWERTLYQEIDQCEAVVIIQTSNWLESKWCFAEFTQARALGKPIFPVIEAPDGSTLISPDIQTLDLKTDREGGLEQLAKQLTLIALNAQGGFKWDVNRAPYPGLLAFQEDDAAIYFGRDDDIRRLIERLNARRVQGGARLVAMLGASGSGKSSLMRAGVIPRLKRAGKTWIVVDPMRPQAQPVDELSRTLAVSLGEARTWRDIRTRLLEEDAATVMREIAFDLRAAHESTEAHILLPVDQAEELFGIAEDVQSERFLELISAALKANVPILPLFTMRSDHLSDLQSSPMLTEQFEEFSLAPLALSRIPQIIEGPARVAGLRIDDEFVNQASRDAETEDALPLLAFALRELYDRGAKDNYLSLEEYKRLGDEQHKLTPLENAVRRRADEVMAEAHPDNNALAALRDAFVPAMVRVNDQGEFVRQQAQWNALPKSAHPLLTKLATARLLVVRQEGEDRMVEVAHEALLRKWPLLNGWLNDARDFLSGKRQLEAFIKDWQDAPDASQKQAALLSGLVLTRAQTWLEERPGQLTSDETALINASIQQREAKARRLQSLNRQKRNVFVGAFIVTLGLLGLAGYQWIATEKQRTIAQKTADNLDETALETLQSLATDQVVVAGAAPGVIETSNRDWVQLLQDRQVTDTNSIVTNRSDKKFLTARPYGQGRVIAAAHDSILVLCNTNVDQCKNEPPGVQHFFLRLITSWLAYNTQSKSRGLIDTSRKVKIGLSRGHCEIIAGINFVDGAYLMAQLSSMGYDVGWVDNIDESTLTELDVLIVGNAWGDFAQNDVDSIENFVSTGGGLLAAGLGWSWRDFLNKPFGEAACPEKMMMTGQNTDDMSTYPMNRLLKPFGAAFTAEVL